MEDGKDRERKSERNDEDLERKRELKKGVIERTV